MNKINTKTQTAPQTDQELQDLLNERAEAFTKNFAKVGYESGHGQNFVRELCGVYGLNYLRSVDFERRVPNATLYHFGMLNSTMHNAWTRAVCGRLESRYRYSNTIVYNNYPWPKPTKAHMAAIEVAGQAVLDARAKHTGKSLAWLYNPETMPKNLQAAHDLVDEAVDEAYGYEKGNDDTSRVAYLFELYEKLTAVKAPAVSAKKPSLKPLRKTSTLA
nr:type IIL restriction-modification enzyme MmeI [uncultured Limnohabitans sp.]